VSARRPFIGPENPKFIEVPIPRQQRAKPRKVIKGVLPPPRNIFHQRAPNRIDPKYIAATIPEPQTARPAPVDERVAWKRRLAATRRTNFQEAIVDLHTRKVRRDAVHASKARAGHKDREMRFNAPQREDERLTNPTGMIALEDLHLGLPDPGREARIAEKAERFKNKEELKKEERRNSLHSLYMHAREFITTEQQLNEEIEKIFVPSPFGKDHEGEENIWDALGAPPTVQDLLQTVNKAQKNALEFHRGPAHITGERMKKIAEELTGGKMD
jgi:hypothetical protein